MSEESNHDKAGEGAFDRLWWLTRSGLGKTALIVIIGVLALYLLQPLFQPANSTSAITTASPPGFPSLVSFAQISDAYYLVWGFNGKPTDIYSVTAGISTTKFVSVTNTPDYSEFWPVPSPIDNRLAFFAVSPSDERSLRVIDASGANTDVTYNIASSTLRSEYFIDLSTPPQWSSDTVWLAFLGRTAADKPLSVELFVSGVQRSTVYRLTTGGNLVTSMRWSSPTELIYTQQGNDGSLTLQKISVVGLPNLVTPTKLDSLP